MGPGHSLHPGQGPKEVNRGGPGGGDLGANFFKAGQKIARVLGVQVQSAQGRAHGCGYPDGRGAPDRQGADGLDDLVIILDFQIELFRRQTPLVQQPDLIHIPTDAAIGDHFYSGFRFFVFGF